MKKKKKKKKKRMAALEALSAIAGFWVVAYLVGSWEAIERVM